ncbi:hypothetical protein OG979_01870 [Actinomadura citrea]|uniref:hypothetical protein n=1 Tax=Actinomadura citrea TaxID=46158 RepID=UPI002E2ABC75|nr:hypothetical protein [Actinomadura citrea]
MSLSVLVGNPRPRSRTLQVALQLRPLLVELGATVPTPGLAFLESQVPGAADVLGAWADLVAPQVSAALARRRAGRVDGP